MKYILIVGLGNIGTQYTHTRHNVGFLCLESLAQSIDSKAHFKNDKKLLGEILEFSLSDFLESLRNNKLLLSQLKSIKDSKNSNFIESNLGHNEYKILLLKPSTFMNNSGESLKCALKYYNIAKIIVAFDDLDTRLGCVNFRVGGGSGGHNGIKSLDLNLKSLQDSTCDNFSDYIKVKIGIGANLFFLNSKIIESNFDFIRVGQSRVEFELICNAFVDTLRQRFSFNAIFKNQSFEKVLKNAIFSEKNLANFPNLESFYKTLPFNTLHKSLNAEISHYVLSNFLHNENAILPHILAYAATCIQAITFESIYHLQDSNITKTPLDTFNVRVRI